MIAPKLLQKGDCVALLAASSPGNTTRLDTAVKALEQLGLSVRVMESCSADRAYLSGSDALRAADIHAAFADDTVKGIFAWRGGYGTQRLLPLLDYDLIRRNPKVFAGYSDVTALHTVFNQRCGLITFHAPMAGTELYDMPQDDFTFVNFTQHVMGKSGQAVSVLLQNPEKLETLVPGYAAGILTGGNLSLIASSLGTPYEIDTRDKILFLEDVGEEAYRIDRMLNQLRLAGKFSQCRGILLGNFQPENNASLRMAFEDLIIGSNKPTIANLSCGHCLPTLTLPLGATMVMNATDQKIAYTY